VRGWAIDPLVGVAEALAARRDHAIPTGRTRQVGERRRSAPVIVVAVFDDATVDDLPAIVDLYNDVIATTSAIYRDEPVTAADRAAWLAERRADGFPVLVARDEGTGAVVGLGSYGWFKASPSGYATTVEHTVLVAPHHRGAGLGTRLVEALIARAADAGFHMMVGLIDAENTNSIRLHERLGFCAVARMPEVARKDGAWVDLVIVQRAL
jgi:L-amino acid N-acyltransferase YncA